MMDFTISGRYKLKSKLGEGAFGVVYLGIDLRTNTEVAVKLEKLNTKNPQLKHEAKVYKCLNAKGSNLSVFFPVMHHFCISGDYTVLVMDLLGSDVGQYIACNKGRPIEMIFSYNYSMLCAIEALHQKGFIHRDIKPENFVIDPKKGDGTPHFIRLIDFGLAKRFLLEGKSHISYGINRSLIGTVRYASRNTHQGIEQTRRDDMESFCYVMIYLAKGSLPWQGCKAENRSQKFEKIAEIKNGTSSKMLCEGLPVPFLEILRHCRNLKFDETPKYNHLKNIFLNYLFPPLS